MSNFASASRATLASRRGASALEFALIGGLLFLMILVALEVGRFYMTVQGVRNFVADSSRYGVVNMSAGQTLCRSQLLAAMGRGGVVGGLASTNPGICVTRSEATVGGGGTAVTVTVTTDVTIQILLTAFGIGPQRFQDTTTVRFVY